MERKEGGKEREGEGGRRAVQPQTVKNSACKGFVNLREFTVVNLK